MAPNKGVRDCHQRMAYNKMDKEEQKEIDGRVKKKKLDSTAKIISDFLIVAEKDFKVSAYTDNMDRCCTAFEIKVGEVGEEDKHTLIIYCNEDMYIGFDIEDKNEQTKTKIN